MIKTTRKKILLSILLGSLFFLQTSVCSAKSVHDLKAAYLYNFIKFISWPDEPSTDIEIKLCLLGEDASNDKFKRLEQRPIHGHPLLIKSINQYDDTSDCSVLFIGASEEKFLNDIFTTLGDKPTLTVSSIPHFAAQGGTIGFVTMGNVIRFDINLKQATKTQLSISSKLLELANQVVR